MKQPILARTKPTPSRLLFSRSEKEAESLSRVATLFTRSRGVGRETSLPKVIFNRSCPPAASIPAPELRQQPEDFRAEPDKGHHEGERTLPLKVFRGPALCSLLDEVEVEHEVQGRDHNHDQAEADPDRPD